MKKLLVMVIFASLVFASCEFRCESNCYVIIESDYNKQCGLANNGFDQENTQPIGKLCGKSEVQAAEKQHNKSYTETAFCNGRVVTYTRRTRLYCP